MIVLNIQVFDATNTTFERRQLIREIIVDKMGYKLFFVESVCDDPAIIESNIRQVKITSPDYAGMDKEAAVEDFLQRIDHYHDQYQTLDEVEEDGLSFMKIFNTGKFTSSAPFELPFSFLTMYLFLFQIGEKVLVHKHEGHIQSRIVYYLMNIHITPRTIYLTRVSLVANGRTIFLQYLHANLSIGNSTEKVKTTLPDTLAVILIYRQGVASTRPN